MKQKLLNLTRLRSLLLLACVMLGVSAWGATYEYDFSTGGVNGTSTNTWSTNYYTILQEQGESNTAVGNYLTEPRWYQNHLITFTPANGITITKIEIRCNAANHNGQDMTVENSSGSITKNGNNSTWAGSITNTSPVTLKMGKQCRPTEIVITYSSSVASYTIIAESNNTSYGTVSLSGNTITATPATGYRVSTTSPYTITTGTATVAQNGNVFTVTASSDCTVCINFEAIPTYTVTLGDDNSTLNGEVVTLPSRSDIGDYTFAGWSGTNVSSETTTAPTIIPAGEYTPTADITLYPVYTKSEGGVAPPAFSVGDTGDYAIVSEAQNGKYYALPNNPTVNNGKITAQEITVSEIDGVKYVTPTNAEGFVWSIASETNGYTIFNGTKYIFHSNGGASGTNLSLGTNTTYKWSFTKDGDYIKMAGMSGNTTNNRGLLFNGTTIGGYALSNWEASGYYKSMILPINAGATTYYWSSPVSAAVERPVITVAQNPFMFSTTATITCSTEGASIQYGFDGENWIDYSSTLTITEAKTIYAKAFKGSDESAIASVTITKNLAEPTLTIITTGITNTNVYTGTAAGSLSATVAFNDVNISGATVTWSSNNDGVAIINESTGAVTLVAAGSVTFTATYAGNGDYSEKTATYQMTVTNYDPAPRNYTLATSIVSGKHYIIVGKKDDVARAMGEQKNNNRAAVDVTINEGTITFSPTIGVYEFVIYGPDANGRFAIYDPTNAGYLYAASGSNNYLKTQASNNVNGQWSISFSNNVASIVADVSSTRNVMQYNSSSDGLFSCYASDSQSPVYLYVKSDEATPSVPVSITSAGLATFSSINAVDFTDADAVEVYTATVGTDGKITYNSISKVPANTGVVLRSTEGNSVNISVPTLSGGADVIAANDLVAVSQTIEQLASTNEDGTTNYILNIVNDKLGFYKANNKKVAAGKAYLKAGVDESRSFIGVDDMTGIESIAATVSDGQYYDLQGRRVAQPQKGLYIVNGKKVIIK